MRFWEVQRFKKKNEASANEWLQGPAGEKTAGRIARQKAGRKEKTSLDR